MPVFRVSKDFLYKFRCLISRLHLPDAWSANHFDVARQTWRENPASALKTPRGTVLRKTQEVWDPNTHATRVGVFEDRRRAASGQRKLDGNRQRKFLLSYEFFHQRLPCIFEDATKTMDIQISSNSSRIPLRNASLRTQGWSCSVGGYRIYKGHWKQFESNESNLKAIWKRWKQFESNLNTL